MRVAAHRGASADCPENTLAAFRAAVAAGCGLLECDVRQTKDGVLVLSHDPDLRRTAGRPVAIGEKDYAELVRYDIGSWFDARFAAERLPRFEDLLGLIPESAGLHIDIKQTEPPYPGMEENLLRAVRGVPGWKERMMFASSDLGALKRLPAGIRLGYQPRETQLEQALEIAGKLKAACLVLNIDRLTPTWVGRAHAAGLEVFVYSANTPEDHARMEALGVDLVFSSCPARIRA